MKKSLSLLRNITAVAICFLLSSVFFAFAQSTTILYPEYTEKTYPLISEEYNSDNTYKDYKESSSPITLYISNPTTKEPFALDMLWNEDWLEKSAYIYNHGLARVLCTLACSSYSYPNGKEKSPLALSFNALGFKSEDISFYYEEDGLNDEDEKDRVSFALAHKTSARGKPVVAIVVRGTVILDEWISNVNMADSYRKTKTLPVEHEGFSKAAKQVYTTLCSYMEEHSLSFADSTFLLAGHSRGAAVCNLLGVRLYQDGVKAESIFDYTVACPNVTRSSDVKDKAYSYIWNIVNQEDMVPSMPFSDGEWGYHKYGQELAIINSFTCKDYEKYEHEYLPALDKYFTAFHGRNFYPFYTGNFLPFIMSTLMRMINRDPTRFYSGVLPLHDPLTNSLDDMFFGTEEEQNPTLINRLIEKYFPGLLEYTNIATNDMHASETYLSWLLTLEADDVYTTTNTFIIEFFGNVNAKVVDDSGKVFVEIKNDMPSNPLYLGGFPALWLFEGTVYMCIPGNGKYHLVISDDCILGTYVKAKINTYTAGGSLIKTRSYNKLRANWYKVYEVDFDNSNYAMQCIKGSEATTIARESAEHGFSLRPEITFGRGWLLGAGVQAGWPLFYTRAGFMTNVWYGLHSFDFYGGLGGQVLLAGAMRMGLEASVKGVFDVDPMDSSFFYVVPYAGLMFSFQPWKKLRIRASVGTDFCFKDFNENAFNPFMVPVSAWAVNRNGDFALYPTFDVSIQF